MNRLQIHRGPRRVVEKARQVLASFIDIDEVYLGEGTALESRWHHRESTDLDFFACGSAVDTLFYELDALDHAMTACWNEGLINGRKPVVVRDTVLHFEIDGTPISIGRVHEFHGESGDIEFQTGIKLSSNEDILTKKLLNRLVENTITTERDAYDFAVARALDFNAMAFAWEHLDGHERNRAMNRVQERMKHSDTYGAGDKQVLAPKYPQLLENLWEDVLKMLASDLSYKPLINRCTDQP